MKKLSRLFLTEESNAVQERQSSIGISSQSRSSIVLTTLRISGQEVTNTRLPILSQQEDPEQEDP